MSHLEEPKAVKMSEITREKKFFLLLFNNISDTQRVQIQNVVDTHALSWWHQHEAVWIVQGDFSSVTWRARFSPILKGVGGHVYVFELPGNGKRGIAFFAKPIDYQWLLEDPFRWGAEPKKEIE